MTAEDRFSGAIGAELSEEGKHRRRVSVSGAATTESQPRMQVRSHAGIATAC
jgi:hypothetical protein